MMYRSDHDAALARVAALEAENAALQHKLVAPSPVAAPTKKRRYWPVALVAMIGVGATLSSKREHRGAEMDSLDQCARLLSPKPALDERSTDPHRWKHSIAPVLGTTGCRDEIRARLQSFDIADKERAALDDWQHAEDALANEVSLIATYYASDPYAADNYASARQLWSEYDRTYEARRRALEDWRDQIR